MAPPACKVMSAKEAIGTFVHDGDHLVIGNYTVGTCAELVFEVIRQHKKGLTLYSQSGVFDVEVLVACGCLKRLVSTYVYRAGGKEGGAAVERALQAVTLQMEDYTIPRPTIRRRPITGRPTPHTGTTRTVNAPWGLPWPSWKRSWRKGSMAKLPPPRPWGER